MKNILDECLQDARDWAEACGVDPDSPVVIQRAHDRYLSMITPPPERQPSNAELGRKLDRILEALNTSPT